MNLRRTPHRQRRCLPARPSCRPPAHKQPTHAKARATIARPRLSHNHALGSHIGRGKLDPRHGLRAPARATQRSPCPAASAKQTATLPRLGTSDDSCPGGLLIPAIVIRQTSLRTWLYGISLTAPQSRAPANGGLPSRTRSGTWDRWNLDLGGSGLELLPPEPLFRSNPRARHPAHHRT